MERRCRGRLKSESSGLPNCKRDSWSATSGEVGKDQLGLGRFEFFGGQSGSVELERGRVGLPRRNDETLLDRKCRLNGRGRLHFVA